MMIIRNTGQILSLHLKNLSFTRQLCSQVKTGGSQKDKWDLYAGVLLERLPILTKPLNDVETRVQVFYRKF